MATDLLPGLLVTFVRSPVPMPLKQVLIQPSALFSIFDQFQRRSKLCTGRMIGAIFGERTEETQSAVISQAFPIPHSEINDQVQRVWLLFDL